jgi:hypothetical protein
VIGASGLSDDDDGQKWKLAEAFRYRNNIFTASQLSSHLKTKIRFCREHSPQDSCAEMYMFRIAINKLRKWLFSTVPCWDMSALGLKITLVKSFHNYLKSIAGHRHK